MHIAASLSICAEGAHDFAKVLTIWGMSALAILGAPPSATAFAAMRFPMQLAMIPKPVATHAHHAKSVPPEHSR
jgi:hypothetical protein